MADKKVKTEIEKEKKELQKKAALVLGETLEFLDNIPDEPQNETFPFPYGSSKARPYGWDIQSVYSNKNL